MRRRLGFLLVWTVATLVTVEASWLGIRSALFAAGPSRAQPLSAAELRRAAPTTAPPTPPVTPSPSAVPSVTAPPSASASATVESPVPPSVESWVAVPDGRGGITFRRSFHLRGGDVTIVCGAREVKVVTVSSGTGFKVEQSHPAPLAVLVTFLAAGHTSRVYANWRDAPYAEITESAP